MVSSEKVSHDNLIFFYLRFVSLHTSFRANIMTTPSTLNVYCSTLHIFFTGQKGICPCLLFSFSIVLLEEISHSGAQSKLPQWSKQFVPQITVSMCGSSEPLNTTFAFFDKWVILINKNRRWTHVRNRVTTEKRDLLSSIISLHRSLWSTCRLVVLYISYPAHRLPLKSALFREKRLQLPLTTWVVKHHHESLHLRCFPFLHLEPLAYPSSMFHLLFCLYIFGIIVDFRLSDLHADGFSAWITPRA